MRGSQTPGGGGLGLGPTAATTGPPRFGLFLELFGNEPMPQPYRLTAGALTAEELVFRLREAADDVERWLLPAVDRSQP